jgi:hypothetical protein
MDKEQCLDNLNILTKDLSVKIRKKAKSLIESGALNLDKYENDYELPRILLIAAISQICDEIPLLERQKDEIKNLKRF